MIFACLKRALELSLAYSAYISVLLNVLATLLDIVENIKLNQFYVYYAIGL